MRYPRRGDGDERHFPRGAAAAIDHPRDGIVELEKRGEIPAHLGWRGYGGQLRQCLANAQALVISEKEQFVPDDGSTRRAAEYIPPQLRRGQPTRNSRDERTVLPLVGVEEIITQKLKNIAVKFVGARFDGCVDDAAGVVAELGGSILGNQIEFSDRIRRWCVAREIIGCLIIVDTI